MSKIMDDSIKDIIVATNDQKVLSYMSDYPSRDFFAAEIQKETGLSKGGVNLSLRRLSRVGFVDQQKKAGIFLYRINYRKSIIRQYKILKSILELEPIVEKIKADSLEIILFGSCARGSDDTNSDIDLFILANVTKRVQAKLAKNNLKRQIQAIIQTPLDWTETAQKNPIFYEEIRQGIVLWEEKDGDRI